MAKVFQASSLNGGADRAEKYTASVLTFFFFAFLRQGARGDPGPSGQAGYLGGTVSLALTLSGA